MIIKKHNLFSQSIRRVNVICIGSGNVNAPCLFKAAVQRISQAKFGGVLDDSDSIITEQRNAFNCIVITAKLVDNQHFKIRKILSEKRLHRVHNIILTVISGYDNRHLRRDIVFFPAASAVKLLREKESSLN